MLAVRSRASSLSHGCSRSSASGSAFSERLAERRYGAIGIRAYSAGTEEGPFRLPVSLAHAWQDERSWAPPIRLPMAGASRSTISGLGAPHASSAATATCGWSFRVRKGFQVTRTELAPDSRTGGADTFRRAPWAVRAVVDTTPS